MDILIGGAWPYANGSLHIGHLAALLPGDVLARYHRAAGNRVCYVSGSDCHGTPVSIRARQEGRSPREVSREYHEEFVEVFRRFGFSYDVYSETASPEHIGFVQDFHRKMYEGDYIYEKEISQAYCETCGMFLADRYVVGVCPRCGSKMRGDQCEACDSILEPDALLAPACAFCGNLPVFRTSRHLFIALSRMEAALAAYVDQHPSWRKNAIAFSKRYIREGLRDRAVTRDLDWGIDVPRNGYDDKRIYIWAENVLGYLSMSREACLADGGEEAFRALWGENAKHYYVHGKDNIPFHTIILPALLIAHGGPWRLPDVIISSEYLTLEGRKISTSQNWTIPAKDVVIRHDPDSLRFYLIGNGPEKKDTDFSWQDYVKRHNLDLLGDYGNFVNRTLVFIEKYDGGIVPDGETDGLDERVARVFKNVGHNIDAGFIKDALNEIIDFVHFSNRYFDARRPWITRDTDRKSCDETMFSCVQMIANLAVLLAPFMPFSSDRVMGWLDIENNWRPQHVAPGFRIPPVSRLFERLDDSVADDEISRIGRPS